MKIFPSLSAGKVRHYEFEYNDMINLHCTKKLLAKFPIEKGLLPEGEELNASLSEQVEHNPLAHWHANLLTLQRRKCILMVHDQTRFPLLLTCLTKPDFAALDYHFADALMNTLLKAGANDMQMQTAQEYLAPLSIDNVCDRSVQGSMNQMAQEIEHSLDYNQAKIVEASAYRLGVWLAHSPRNIKGQKDSIWPQQAMLSLLDN